MRCRFSFRSLLRSWALAAVAAAWATGSVPPVVAEPASPVALWDGSVPFPARESLSYPAGAIDQVVHRAGSDGFVFLHDPAVVRHQDFLLAAWYNSAAGEMIGQTMIRGRRSRDGGRTWSDVEVIAADVQRRGILYVPVTFLSHAGRLYAFVANMEGGPDRVRRCEVFALDRQGARWESQGMIAGSFLPNGAPQKTRDGNFLMTGRMAQRSGELPTTPAVAISRAERLTEPWNVVPMLPTGRLPNGQTLSCPESTAWVDASGITALVRREKGNSLLFRSRDGGRTWSAPQEHNFSMAWSKMDAGTLSTGQHYVVCNVSRGGSRDLLVIAVTRPGQDTFCRMWKLRDGPSTALRCGPQWSYPSAIEHDGMLSVVYSSETRHCVMTTMPVKSLAVEPDRASGPGNVSRSGNRMERTADSKLVRMKYNHPGLVVDLAGGLWAWPLPMDTRGDGGLDIVVNGEDVPYNGVYVYENPRNGSVMPVFKPARRLSDGLINAQVSYVDGKPRVLTSGKEYPDFLRTGLARPVTLPLAANVHRNRVRGNMWRYVDFDGDGLVDLVIGTDDWSDYGWDNAFDASGKWLRGPLRGHIYVARNTGSNDQPRYATPYRLADPQDKLLETFGWPSPNVADWDGDGDLDILCGEFLNHFTYFRNIGTRTEPVYAPGVQLKLEDGRPLEMDMQMITPVVVDWNRDGRPDLVCGEEGGRVAWLENTGRLKDGVPLLLEPKVFRQQADELKCSSLVTPFAVDWDGDGDLDLICGNSAGYLVFFENLSGPGVEHPKWSAPAQLQADGKTICIRAGYNGSIQGPAEACYGYTVPNVCDWDGDGLLDIVVNTIWGKVLWYKNVGTAGKPRLAAAAPIEVQWNGPQPALAWGWLRPEGKRLLTQWRTSPVTIDWNRDGMVDLVMLDHEGYLAWFKRVKVDGRLELLPSERVFFWSDGKPLRLNSNKAGRSGRRKFCFADWDGDGKLDILRDSVNVTWLRQTDHRDGRWYFENRGPLDSRRLAGHTTCPTAVDFDHNGIPDLVIGAEDGHFYYLRNPRAAGQ